MARQDFMRLWTFHSNGSILRSLNANKVDFFVIGGLAVHFYGCRDALSVDDLDLLATCESRNLEKLTLALRNFGSFNLPARIERKTQIQIKSAYYTDIMLDPFIDTQIDRDACKSTVVNDVVCSVIDLKSLIRMKEIASTSDSKHETDLECLKTRFSEITSPRRPSR